MTPISTAPAGASAMRLFLRLGVGGIGLGALTGLLPAQVRWARRRGRPAGRAPEGIDGLIGDGGGAPLRVVWLGDSLAAGVGADDADGTLPRLVARQLVEAAGGSTGGRPVHVAVLAVGGATVADIVARQLPRLDSAAAPPDLFVVSAGANDVAHRRTRRQFRDDYGTLLAELAPTPVIALSLPDMGSAICMPQPLRSVARARARMFDRELQRLVAAGASHATHVDIATAPPHVERKHLRDYLASDLFHPSTEGYRLWASAIAAALHGHPVIAGPPLGVADTGPATA